MNTSDSAMTVKEVLGEVAGKRILVPEFLEDADYRSGMKEAEKLFEDILKGYPIGGFTFWNLAEPVPNIMFYEMTEHYSVLSSDRQKRFEMGFRPFRAVLDGHNRLNSLYIGLMGTYACYIRPENKGDDKYPPQTLYLNLWQPETSEAEPGQRGRFRFLTEKDYGKETQTGAIWVKAGRILDEDVPSILSSLSMPPEAGKEAEETLGRLADGICSRKIIRCCSVEGGPLDDVIGFLMGKPSRVWDIDPDPKLFYLLAANWDEAKEEFKWLEDSTNDKSDWSNRVLHKDGILRICLACIGSEFQPSAEQFSGLIPKIKREWRRIRPCICQVARLFRNIWGEYPCRLDWNPVLAIIYWFYKKGVSVWPKEPEESNAEFETAVKKWMAFGDYAGIWRNGWFSGCKRVIDETESEVFPFAALRELVMNGCAWKRIDEDDLETIMTSPWDRFGSGYPMSPIYLLPLLCSERVTGGLKKSKAVHLHPKSFFEDREKLKEVFGGKPDDLLFAADPKNWNSVLNLCLMPVEKVDMKEQMSLKEWAEMTGTPNSALCVDPGVSLDIKDFRAFIENRRKRIAAILRDLFL